MWNVRNVLYNVELHVVVVLQSSLLQLIWLITRFGNQLEISKFATTDIKQLNVNPSFQSSASGSAIQKYKWITLFSSWVCVLYPASGQMTPSVHTTSAREHLSTMVLVWDQVVRWKVPTVLVITAGKSSPVELRMKIWLFQMWSRFHSLCQAWSHSLSSWNRWE